MPLIKYVANRLLTFFQNILLSYKLSEYHTGYRAFSAKVLKSIDFIKNSDDFIFDNELLAQIIYKKFDVAEISCPTKYFEDASSISLKRSAIYGLGVLKVSLLYRLSRWQLIHHHLFNETLKTPQYYHETPEYKFYYMLV